MKPLIVANWKMNPANLAEAKKLFDSVKKGIKNVKKAEAVICPPFPYLLSFRFRASSFKLGAQNCFWEEKGAFTGEVSAKMLKNFGCQYVILGHSERRKYFGETDEIINKKLRAALRAKLKPIFCVGESGQEREKGETEEILKSQLEKGLEGIKKGEIKNLILAYEPVWAIGTGKPCSLNEAQIISLYLRKVIARIYSLTLSKKLPILYGGSVNGKNARDYIIEAGMSGLLVGGASLDEEEFKQIIQNTART